MQTVNWDDPDLTLAGIDIAGEAKYTITKELRLPEYYNIRTLRGTYKLKLRA